MTPIQDGEVSGERRLRLWPGIAAVVVQWVFWVGVPALVPGSGGIGFIGALLGGILVLLWWAFFSRAPKLERLVAVLLMVAILAGTRPFLHPSVAGAGMGFLFYVYAIPVVSLALVGWAAIRQRLPAGMVRWGVLAAAMLAACGMWTLVRTDGITGGGKSQFAWRWSKDAEMKLLAEDSEPVVAKTATAEVAPAAEVAVPAAASTPAGAARVLVDWPGFRGPQRDGVVRGASIRTDWGAGTAPVEVWRRKVGPGWSSFAAGGGLLYTQEQRGEHEVVACYNLKSGKTVWTHRDTTRFWEANAGAGPRGTPALDEGRVYAFGATGILNALDAVTGTVVWSRNPATEIGARTTSIEVSRSGDLAYSQGSYEFTANNAQGVPATDRGKFVIVWKKQADGSWKAAADIFNSDLPASPGHR